MPLPKIELNNVSYRSPPRPVVVVCVDGGDPRYFEHALVHGYMPNLGRFYDQGFATVAQGTVPSFTCPNNMSIVTGAPAAIHGISGNFFLDRDTGEAVVMTGPELLRSRTIFAEFADAGARVGVVTAKDKLRAQLGKSLDLTRGNVCFSAQCADRATLADNGIADALSYVGLPLPDMYSADLSLFVMEAGIRLLSEGGFTLLYLSLTDYIQHKHGPGESACQAFYEKLDEAFGRLASLGATVAITADHGMNDKAKPDGSPNVIWLQDRLDAQFGTGICRVICPITDPFVAHHGALGGFVRVYTGPDYADASLDYCRGLAGVDSVFDRAAACAEFDLPFDREGDVVVIADAGTCIGGSEGHHDLSGLADARLRTHGGVAESRVPLVVSHPLNESYTAKLASLDPASIHSYQVFDVAINGID